MPKIKVNRPIRFTPGTSYAEAIKLPVGIKDDFDPTYLADEYIRALIEEGAIEVLEGDPGDLTVAQIKEAILKIKPDFDFKGLKKKDDFKEALAALQKAQAPEETK